MATHPPGVGTGGDAGTEAGTVATAHFVNGANVVVAVDQNVIGPCKAAQYALPKPNRGKTNNWVTTNIGPATVQYPAHDERVRVMQITLRAMVVHFGQNAVVDAMVELNTPRDLDDDEYDDEVDMSQGPQV